MTLDGIAKKILQELANGPLTSGQIAASSAGGAVRMISPRLVWLEGLGMVESTGPDTYGITELGLRFLSILD
jgi:DNA-binding HxlR family transcriptional regulator